MTKRRAHSSIDKLPADLRETLTRMIVDGVWPDDFPKAKALGFGGEDKDIEGKPRYADLVTYCVHKGHAISESSIGRWAKGIRVLAMMRTKAEIVRGVFRDVTAEDAPKTQKAAAEIITAKLIEISVEENHSPKEIMNLARAVKDCTAVSISADKYVREQIKAKVEKTASSIKDKLNAAGVNKKVQKVVDELLLGIAKS